MPDDPVLDDLKDFKEDLEEIPERKGFKKLLSIVLGLFMLSIIVIYFLPGDTVSILEGKLESSKLDGFTAEFDGGKVVFSKGVYELLREMYINNQETEIKVCLTGEMVGDEYHITGLELPRTYSATVYSVTSEACSEETLIPLHTHPFRHCLFSEQDIKSYEAFKEINPDAIYGMMCEIDRFSFYK